MILDLAYNSKDTYTSNQIRSRPTYLSGLDTISLHTRNLYYLANTLSNEAIVHIKKKS